MSNNSSDFADWARDVVVEGIRRDIRKLINGRQDRDAAESLLREFRLDGPIVQPDVYQWLYDAFGRILDGDDPATALGLKRKRGQKKRIGSVDKIAIVMYVELKRREGMSQRDAHSAAAEHFRREIRTIENAIREIELPDGLDEETMRDYILTHRRPQ